MVIDSGKRPSTAWTLEVQVSVSTPRVGQRKRIWSEGSRDNSGSKAGGMNLQESGNRTLGIWRSKTQVFVLTSRVGQRRRISSKISRDNWGTKAGGMNTQESCGQSRKYRSMRLDSARHETVSR